VKNGPFNVSQPTSMTTPRTFTAPEVMIPLECNVHGWMHAWLAVLPHPFYAVTGADGSFSLKGLPPGTYTIEAWHEKYGTQTATVTVTAGPKTADFTSPASRRPTTCPGGCRSKPRPFAGEIDGLFTAVLIITGIAFVVVEFGLVWFSLKYAAAPAAPRTTRTATTRRRSSGPPSPP